MDNSCFGERLRGSGSCQSLLFVFARLALLAGILHGREIGQITIDIVAELVDSPAARRLLLT